MTAKKKTSQFKNPFQQIKKRLEGGKQLTKAHATRSASSASPVESKQSNSLFGKASGHGLPSPFKPTTVEILPIASTYIIFDFHYVEHQIIRLNNEGILVSDIVATTGKNIPPSRWTALKQALDQYWEEQPHIGAYLIFPWDKDEKIPFEMPIVRQTTQLLIAHNPLLVLNVLARVRANLLLAQTPLALEEQYLMNAFISDDPRLVKLAQTSGTESFYNLKQDVAQGTS